MLVKDPVDLLSILRSIRILNGKYQRQNGSLRNICLTSFASISQQQQQIDVRKYPLIDAPLVLLDTANVLKQDVMALHDKYPNMEPDDFYEAKYEDSKSFYNRGEALCVAHQMFALRGIGGLHYDEIGCITPYTAQTNEIRRLLDNDLFDVNSVDGFQGQQREAIVMSFVRNNGSNSIGFLAKLRRMNVAITRAKRQFFLVASSRSLKSNPGLEKLYNIILQDGLVITPKEFLVNSPFHFKYEPVVRPFPRRKGKEEMAQKHIQL